MIGKKVSLDALVDSYSWPFQLFLVPLMYPTYLISTSLINLICIVVIVMAPLHTMSPSKSPFTIARPRPGPLTKPANVRSIRQIPLSTTSSFQLFQPTMPANEVENGNEVGDDTAVQNKVQNEVQNESNSDWEDDLEDKDVEEEEENSKPTEEIHLLLQQSHRKMKYLFQSTGFYSNSTPSAFEFPPKTWVYKLGVLHKAGL